MSVTSCPARHPFAANHDYSCPPHNTPDTPRDSNGEHDPCQAGWHGCADERSYELVVYQPGTHDWVRMQACAPCTAAMRERLGRDVARVATSVRPVEPLPALATGGGVA